MPGIDAIRRLASNATRFRWEAGFAILIARLQPEILPSIAECQELFALAEEIGYGPYEVAKVSGEKPAALRIVGVRDPDAAFRVARSRLRDPDTPDGELYAPLLAALRPDQAGAELLDAARLTPPTRVIRAIGLELGRLGATEAVVEWIADPAVERRRAACRIAGFLPPTEDLESAVRLRVDDADRRVSEAALAAHARLRQTRTAEELVQAFVAESDVSHRWAILDAFSSVADPDSGSTNSAWHLPDGPQLTPAMARHLSERMKERRKNLEKELDREDRLRR